MPEAQSNCNAKEEGGTESTDNIQSNENHVSLSGDKNGDDGITKLAEIMTVRCVSK